MLAHRLNARVKDLRALARDSRGLAAVEFAMGLPVMLVMFMGTIEATNILTADRRAQSVAATLCDLTARDDSITTAEMDDIFSAATAVLADFPTGAPQMVVTSIVNNAGTVKVDWSRAKNAAPDASGGSVTGLPTGLLATGGSVIRVRVTIPYSLTTMGATNYKQQSNGKTIMKYDMGATHNMSKTFYLRPRLVQQIPAPT
ncbi:MAG: TadE/TadG family type IV pilus assembly protein [Caulobacterales bacterium]